MPDEAQVVLAQLLQTHGRDLAHDARRLRAMLADTMPGTADAKRLVAAAEEGIPAQLLAAGSDPTGATRLQLIRRLEEQRDMTAQAAAWTVDAWATALEVPLMSSGFGGSDEPTRPVPGPAEDDAPPPRGRPLWIAAVAGAVLVGVVVVAASALLRPGVGETGDATPTPSPVASAETSSEPSASSSAETTPEPTAEPTERPSSTPVPLTAAEQELLSWVPTGTADSCSSTDLPDVERTVAQLDCRVSGMIATIYVLYRSPQAMRQQYDEYAQGSPGGGSCAQGDLPSELAWNFESVDAGGRYSCFRSEGRVWVVWTANYANILAWGYRTDGRLDKLYDAWLSSDAGPRTSPG